MDLIFRITQAIDAVNNVVGKSAAWLAVAMVLVQFVIVMLRYVFGFSFIWMQESVVYFHAALFMLGASYTLLHDGHVRVDIFYHTASAKKQAMVDLLGSLFFLLPVCGLILVVSWPYVAQSWSMWEGSQETSGIQAVYLRKSLLIAFAGLMALQGVALLLTSLLTLFNHVAPDIKKDGAQV